MSLRAKAYKDYENKLYSYTNEHVFTEEELHALFAELLSVLPNNGKLYKYKCLETFHVDELEEKYIWIPSAKDLNDNKDCVFNANSFEEIMKISHFLAKKDNFIRVLAMGIFSDLQKENSKVAYEDVLACFENLYKYSEKVWSLKFNNFCVTFKLNNEQCNKILTIIRFLKSYVNINDAIENYVKTFIQMQERVRNEMHIFSLTSSFKKDSMWAYYAKNQGICLEYDFNKIVDWKIKRLFINTYKVRYGKKKKFSYTKLIQSKIHNDEKANQESDRMIMSQLLTKDKSWSTEEEWRIVSSFRKNEKGYKLSLDIVSAVYVDYSVLHDKKALKIISLAKANNWNVYVRFFDKYNAEYCYETIDNIQTLKEKYSMFEKE